MRTDKQDKTFQLVMTALMTCLIIVATMIIRIPIPATEGYVHLGDAMIFLSVIILGRRNASIASGAGSALADIFAGYAYFAPWTLAVKALMAFIMGSVIISMEKKGSLDEHISSGKLSFLQIIAMIAGGVEMTVGYYLAEIIMTGNVITPLASIPANIGQFAVGAAIATILVSALYRTPARKYFYYK